MGEIDHIDLLLCCVVRIVGIVYQVDGENESMDRLHKVILCSNGDCE